MLAAVTPVGSAAVQVASLEGLVGEAAAATESVMASWAAAEEAEAEDMDQEMVVG